MTPERFVRIFKELCVIDVDPDGLTFDAPSVKADRITETPTTKVCALPSPHTSSERAFPSR
jgi:hypothetical protein